MPELRLAPLWAASIACLIAWPAQAADDEHAAIARVMADPNFQQHVISGAEHSTVMLQNPCAEAQYSIEPRFVPYQPLSFGGDGHIVSGAWKQMVDERGCGENHALNVLILGQGAGSLTVIPLLPGGTHADPVLQKDAVRIAVGAVSSSPGGREPNCTVGYVADTEYLGEEGEALPGSKGRPWKERWTLASCTQKMLVPVQFVPDSTGTSITAGPNRAIQIIRN